MTAFAENYMADPNSGCWLWTGYLDKAGYGVASKRSRPIRCHRLSWELHRGEIPKGLNVLHKCDVRSCCNPDHLFLGTTADNIADKVAKGRQARGEKTNTAKLTADQVTAIRSATGTQRKLATQYGVTQGLISHIITRRAWGHI